MCEIGGWENCILTEPVAHPPTDAADPKTDGGQGASAAANLPAMAQKPDHSIKHALQQLKDSTDQFFGSLRYNTVRFLPAIIVNNSSNILGLAHVYTEGIMFKASLKGGKLVEHASNPLDYLLKATWRVYKDAIDSVFNKNNPHMHVDIFKGNVLENVVGFVTDTEAATRREIQAQKVSPLHVQLGNPWQTRATLSGLIGWSIASIWPEKKESDAEIERMEIMRKNNPVGYIGTRVGQAVWLPGWMTHKREVIGIWQATAGVFSMLGAWRNRAKPNAMELVAGKLPKYVFNLPYFATGLCSFLSGTTLMFAPDEATGYSQYGGWVNMMSFFIPFSVGEKFRQKEPGTGWYLAGKLSFQGEAWGQWLFGGAEKKPDGTIVDHTALRKEADAKAAELRAEKHVHKYAPEPRKELPATRVSGVEGRAVLNHSTQAQEMYG